MNIAKEMTVRELEAALMRCKNKDARVRFRTQKKNFSVDGITVNGDKSVNPPSSVEHANLTNRFFGANRTVSEDEVMLVSLD